MFQIIVNSCILATDSTLLKSHGKVWHKSSMNKGMVPCSGIDTDARCGYSHTKGWIFGYKLHMVCSTDSNVVPLAADVTTANISDNQVYLELISSSSSLSPEIIMKTHYMVADRI